MASANQVIDEIDDFLDVITNTKLKKLSENLEKLYKGISNPIEKKKTQESCQRDVERINNDLKSLNFDLKRLPKDREQEFSDKVASVKAKLNKMEKKLKSIDEPADVADVEIDMEQREEMSNRPAKKKKKKRLVT